MPQVPRLATDESLLSNYCVSNWESCFKPLMDCWSKNKEHCGRYVEGRLSAMYGVCISMGARPFHSMSVCAHFVVGASCPISPQKETCYCENLAYISPCLVEKRIRTRVVGTHSEGYSFILAQSESNLLKFEPGI